MPKAPHLVHTDNVPSDAIYNEAKSRKQAFINTVSRYNADAKRHDAIQL